MASREQVGVDIDVTAFDNASKVLRAIEQNLQRLNRISAAPPAFSAARMEQMGRAITRYQQVVSDIQKSRTWTTIAPFGMPATTMPFTEAMDTRLFRFGERLRSVIDRVSEGYKNLSQNSEQTAKRIRNVSQLFRRAAGTMLWGALGVLGVTWSMQGMISQSIQPLMKYVNLMTNWADAAFSVATWLAIAQMQGFDVGEWLGGKEAGEVIEEIINNGLFLQSTIGNLQSAMLIFMNNVLNYSEQAEGGIISVKDAISALMDKIMEFVNNPEVVAVFGKFAIGAAEGAGQALDIIRDNIKDFDNVLAGLMDTVATMLDIAVQVPKNIGGIGDVLNTLGKGLEEIERVSGISLPGELLRTFGKGIKGITFETKGVEELIRKIQEAQTGAQKFGIFVGAMATFEPILAPILSFIQLILTLTQIVVFGISVMVDLVAIGAKMLPHLATIAGALAFLAGISGIKKFSDKMIEEAKKAMVRGELQPEGSVTRTYYPELLGKKPKGLWGSLWDTFFGWIPSIGGAPQTVNQTVYVNADISTEVDLEKFEESLKRALNNSTGGASWA